MNDVYLYYVDLPPGIHEMICPCLDGYTVYLSNADDTETQRKSYAHALLHIKNHDFEKENVQEIESSAHQGEI